MSLRARGDSNFRTVVFSSLANLAIPLCTLITGPLLARTLGPHGRGWMAALLSPLALANLMFTLGVPDALTYFVAGKRLAHNGALRVAFAGGLVSAALAAAVLWFSESYLFRNQKELLPAFNWLLLTLPLTLMFSAVRGILQGQRKFGLINQERLVGAVVRLVALFALVAAHRLTPITAVWISTLSGVMASGLLLRNLRGKTGHIENVTSVGHFTRYAAAAAFGTFGGLIVIRLDQVLMVALTTPAQLAYYAVAASLSELPLTLVAASRDMAFSLASAVDDPEIVARFCRLTVLAMLIVCLTGALATPLVLPLLFGKSFSPAVMMAEILLVGTIGRAITTIIGAGLMTTERTWLRSAIQLAGAAFTAALLFVLVPRWGGIGAAWVTTLTYAAMALASLLVYLQTTGLTFARCLVPGKADLLELRVMASRFLRNQDHV